MEEVVVEDGRAVGVRLKGGKTIGARQAVVSNADLYHTFKLVPPGAMQALTKSGDQYLAPAAPVYADDAGQDGARRHRPALL